MAKSHRRISVPAGVSAKMKKTGVAAAENIGIQASNLAMAAAKKTKRKKIAGETAQAKKAETGYGIWKRISNMKAGGGGTIRRYLASKKAGGLKKLSVSSEAKKIAKKYPAFRK